MRTLTKLPFKFLLIGFISSLFLLACKPEPGPIIGPGSSDIRINQIGYYPNGIKKAVIAVEPTTLEFALVDSGSKRTVYQGQLSEVFDWPLANEQVRIADFTEFQDPGEYVLYIPNLGNSHPFEIRSDVLNPVLEGSVKGLYFQRTGMALDEKHAGKWHRPAGHPDSLVAFHPSSGKQPGTIASPKGWYDAGDYNKYIINATFPLGQWFRLYEEYPETIPDDALNIPESGNGVSDYLDELKYELDWALTMQDEDGGLFHKLTTKNFEGMVMPHQATAERFIVGKSTAATLDFAACTAQAYRVYQDINPEYAKACLDASLKAYRWARENPEVLFSNPEDVHTGEYGDNDVADEWFWANAELFVSTGDSAFLEQMDLEAFDFEFRPGESWTGFMRFLGVFSMLDSGSFETSDSNYQHLRAGLLGSADELLRRSGQLPYFQPIDDFHWGSNSDVLNAAMILAQAYQLDPDPKYLQGVRQAADYILGNNPVGYSYVTGFGDRTPLFIHHRQSAADSIPEPVPGLLSGGPNSRLQDTTNGTVYPENVAPMKAWVDQEPSYASNEICLNWNAPLTYILGFLENQAD
ncbi:non-processive endocellulase [Robiginitalea myxolifaciens]|uniref:Endoglucanase n=1 Tax=Robiginitalea myxolifaciens TaxID=400055 RepID=A0A1I6GCT7_9FLAO|nr:glycoside hydrolase family 9 protein [Robiginitalea myxolifaciens]SFR39887.1 non-processive endocellulase [Robiginitalea myxolifaciens]